MRILLLVMCSFYLSASVCLAEEEIPGFFGKVDFEKRLVGRPETKASCDITGCLHEQLDTKDGAKVELVITRSGDTYYWTSRDVILLSKEKSSEVLTSFIAGGRGYVRTIAVEGRCSYMEHLTLALSTVTYWGACEAQ